MIPADIENNAMPMRINAAWHAQHRMPKNAGADERIAWHVAHASNCACRPIPDGVLRLMSARRIALPAEKTKRVRRKR
jgi:hypothetical protein